MGVPSTTQATQKCRKHAFIEVFAGEGNLSKAVGKMGAETMPLDAFTDSSAHFDLLKDSHFKKLKKYIKSKRIRWLHLAPPCRTYS